MKIAPTKIRRQISNFFIGLSSCEIVILVVDDLGSDVADNIEVQNERALVLVRISIVTTNLGHTEINKVVAVRLLVVIDPTDNSAGFLYIRHNASSTKNIGKTDIMIAVGFSAGGMNVMQVVANQFGTTNTPDKVYPSYVCDAVDYESADLNVAIPIYGLFVTGLNFTKNPNLPPVFGVVGQKDGLSAMMLPSLPECADIFKDFSFYLAPDAPHGVGLGTGTKGYVDYYTQIAQWPDMAVNFIESRLGLMEKKIDMDSVGFAW